MPGTVRILRCTGDRGTEDQDAVAIEQPMEIRVNAESLAVTMRTPGNDFELAAGLLYAEGLITCAADLLVIKRDQDPANADRENTILTAVKPWDQGVRSADERSLLATSSCGICGKKDIASTRCLAAPLPPSDFQVAPAALYGMAAAMRAEQHIFSATGGLHAAGLFDARGMLLSLREDIGRHNAVDKLIGAELLAGRLPLTGRILLISGRASYEILQKAAVARIPIVCAVSAPSSLAVQMANDLNITLIGFLRNETMNIYSAPDRIGM